MSNTQSTAVMDFSFRKFAPTYRNDDANETKSRSKTACVITNIEHMPLGIIADKESADNGENMASARRATIAPT